MASVLVPSPVLSSLDFAALRGTGFPVPRGQNWPSLCLEFEDRFLAFTSLQTRVIRIFLTILVHTKTIAPFIVGR